MLYAISMNRSKPFSGAAASRHTIKTFASADLTAFQLLSERVDISSGTWTRPRLRSQHRYQRSPPTSRKFIDNGTEARTIRATDSILFLLVQFQLVLDPTEGAFFQSSGDSGDLQQATWSCPKRFSSKSVGRLPSPRKERFPKTSTRVHHRSWAEVRARLALLRLRFWTRLGPF